MTPTRVGWLADVPSTHLGGAELTQAEFRVAAPEGVEIVDCLPGAIDKTCDRFVVHNCVQYALDDLQLIDRPTVKFWHDVGPWLASGVRDWLDKNARPICCSPIQAQYMGLDAALVPPPVDLGRFEDAAKGMNGNRAGAVSIGSWRNYGKAPHRAAEWARGNGGIDFYGDGVLAPPGAQPVRYEDMPALMARYKTFVFLPSVIEPFGRLVAEAWASGMTVVTNRLVGSLWWIEENPLGLETATSDFWRIVLEA